MAAYLVEVYYEPPTDPQREARVTARVAGLKGWLDRREELEAGAAIRFTFEFRELEHAGKAASALRQAGEQVEGPRLDI